MGIAVRDLTFGGRERAEHAAYPQMWPLTTAIPRDPESSNITGYPKSGKIYECRGQHAFNDPWKNS